MSMEQTVFFCISLILNLFLLLLFVIQICQFIFFRSRLSQLEDLLKKLLKKEGSSPYVPQKNTVSSPANLSTSSPVKIVPEIKKTLPSTEKKVEKESLRANFRRWFIMGHYNKEDVSKEVLSFHEGRKRSVLSSRI